MALWVNQINRCLKYVNILSLVFYLLLEDWQFKHLNINARYKIITVNIFWNEQCDILPFLISNQRQTPQSQIRNTKLSQVHTPPHARWVENYFTSYIHYHYYITANVFSLFRLIILYSNIDYNTTDVFSKVCIKLFPVNDF